jgi:hypothetical protein
MWTVSQLCPEVTPISGYVYRFEGARGPVWRAKYRLPDGRQIHRPIGPAWTERGRPRAGWYTKRTAETWLRGVLDQARAGTLPGTVQTGVMSCSVAMDSFRCRAGRFASRRKEERKRAASLPPTAEQAPG